MRYLAFGVVAIAISACAPAVDDVQRGVGFEPYGSTLETLQPPRRVPLVNGQPISEEPVQQGAPLPLGGRATPAGAGGDASAGAGAGAGGQSAPGQGASGASGDNASAGPAPGAAVIGLDNPGISDEQDFSAVTSRETIESDKARLEAQRRAYKVIRPTALPERQKKDFASIVEYALATSNRVGERVYRRSGLFAKGRFERNCARYPSPDRAQEAFLKAGGPKIDRFGLDPDGDGFACFWDPAPFRQAVRR